jgi:hypothetical protein
MKKHLFEKNCFIGGWYMNPKICDQIIETFNKTPEFTKTKYSLEKNDMKNSTDVRVGNDNFFNPFNNYRAELQNCLEKYIEMYPELKDVGRFNVASPGYNIQHYKKGEGFPDFHFERKGVDFRNRLLVFMTYLNNVKDGGTIFKYQDIIVPAKKGLTLIWPVDFTHVHKSQITNKHEKYIVTGWYNYE